MQNGYELAALVLAVTGLLPLLIGLVRLRRPYDVSVGECLVVEVAALVAAVLARTQFA